MCVCVLEGRLESNHGGRFVSLHLVTHSVTQECDSRSLQKAPLTLGIARSKQRNTESLYLAIYIYMLNKGELM